MYCDIYLQYHSLRCYVCAVIEKLLCNYRKREINKLKQNPEANKNTLASMVKRDNSKSAETFKKRFNAGELSRRKPKLIKRTYIYKEIASAYKCNVYIIKY